MLRSSKVHWNKLKKLTANTFPDFSQILSYYFKIARYLFAHNVHFISFYHNTYTVVNAANIGLMKLLMLLPILILFKIKID